MKLEESKRRFFGWKKMKHWIVSCTVLSVLLLLMLVFKESWQEPAQILVFAGMFHPVFLHLPIGMLVIVVLMEVIARMRGRKSHATMPLAMSALTSVIAVVFGYILMRSNTYPEDSIDAHLWSGVIFTVILIWTLFFKLRYNETGRGQRTYWVLLFLSTALMFATGHYGGVITHGDPLDAAPWNQKNDRKQKRGQGVQMQAGAGLGQQLVYEDIVIPILENKCYNCHGPKKSKGRLRMDSYEAMLEGGDEGPCLVPGDPKKSLMIELIHLPEDDEFRMPPEDKPQLTDAETKVITWWVEMGAPQQTKLESLELPDPVRSALQQLFGAKADKPSGKPAATKPDADAPDPAQIKQKYAETVAKLQQKFPGSLTWLSRGDAHLSLNVASVRERFNDEDLALFRDLAPLLSRVDLTAASISDDSAPILASMISLTSLRLSETKVSDQTVAALTGLKQLESLSLYGTEVSDQGVMQLAAMTQLKHLYLWQSKVTHDGIQALQAKLPDCEISIGSQSPQP